MRPSVAAILPSFTGHFEGRTLAPYLDVLGLVTVGYGCLIDPVDSALGLPWQVGIMGCLDDDVREQWGRVKGAPPQDLTGKPLAEWLRAHAAGYYASLTTMRLTEAAVDELLVDRAAGFESVLLARFGDNWTYAPASVQLATISMCWAEGAGGVTRSPRFDAAFLAGDWPTCAVECHLADAGNPGLVPRNAANRALFLAVASTDPDDVAWPPP